MAHLVHPLRTLPPSSSSAVVLMHPFSMTRGLYIWQRAKLYAWKTERSFLGLGGSSVQCHSKGNLLKDFTSLLGRKRHFGLFAIASLRIELVPCLKDNYAYLLHDTDTGITGIIDPSESKPVINAVERRGLTLSYILNTHHHWDHTGGNMELKSRYGAKVVGPYADQDRIPGIDIALRDGETWMFGKCKLQVLDTPGHTQGHVCFYFPDSKDIFTGDTLFSLSCGKLFEGTPEQMWTSLSKIALLPDDTQVFCGHEYTQSSAAFAVAMEPSNEALRIYFEKIKALRRDNNPTIPSTLKLEKACNPFLRLSSSELRKSLSIPNDASDVEALAIVRAAKDRW